jgi:hypothetical protein
MRKQKAGVADNILLINAATKQTLGFQSLGSTGSLFEQFTLFILEGVL